MSNEKYRQWAIDDKNSPIDDQLFGIYNEAMHEDQNDAGRISKTIAKASTLSARLSADQEATARKLVVQTDRLVKFTRYLMYFTVALLICGIIQIGLMMFDVWIARQL